MQAGYQFKCLLDSGKLYWPEVWVIPASPWWRSAVVLCPWGSGTSMQPLRRDSGSWRTWLHFPRSWETNHFIFISGSCRAHSRNLCHKQPDRFLHWNENSCFIQHIFFLSNVCVCNFKQSIVFQSTYLLFETNPSDVPKNIFLYQPNNCSTDEQDG